MITLKNLTKRTVIFNLPHAVACSEDTCTCSRVKVGVVDHDKVSGDRTVRAVNQRLGHSVTLFPKGTTDAKGKPIDEVSGLLDNVAQVSEVRQAKARFEIEIRRDAPVAAPAATPAAAPVQAAAPRPALVSTAASADPTATPKE